MARETNQLEVFTEEDYELVNEENKELVDEFMEYCVSVDRSPKTIKVYKSDLTIIMNFFRKYLKNKKFTDIQKRDVIKFQNWCIKHNLSPSRIRRLRSVMSSLSNYIENMLDDEYEGFRNIINKIEAPALVKTREKTVLEQEHVDKLLDYLVEKEEYQKACAFALATASGSRKSELLRFEPSFFTDENIIYGSLFKTPKKIKTKGKGSRGKMIYRYVLSKQFEPYFHLWMNQREELGVDIEDLFVVKRKGKWQPAKISTLDSWADTFSKILGFDFYWHSLRHYFTTSLYKYNIPAEVIKNIIGWESVQMVSIYNDTDVDDELGKYFGEDGIKQVENKTLSDL